MELREAPCVVDLDETDTSLVRLLQSDRRISYATIARRLGLAQATVRKRVNRLVKNGVVRLRAVVNPTKVGYPLLVHIGMQVDLDKLEQVAPSLAELHEVRSVYYSTGMYDVVITAVFTSTDALLEFLHKKLGAIEGIKRVDTSQLLRTVKHDHEWQLTAGGEEEVVPEAPRAGRGRRRQKSGADNA